MKISKRAVMFLVLAIPFILGGECEIPDLSFLFRFGEGPPDYYVRLHCDGSQTIMKSVDGEAPFGGEYLWMGLYKDGQPVRSSEGLFVTGGPYHEVLEITFPPDELPSGTFELYGFTTSGPSDVGFPESRRRQAGPIYLDLTASAPSPQSNCIEVLLGDSMHLLVTQSQTAGVLDISRVSTTHFDPAEVPVTWSYNQRPGVGQELVYIGNNTFMPLRMSREGDPVTGLGRVEFFLHADENDGFDDGEVQIIVQPPRRLGNSSNGLDDKYVLYADSFLVPPQILKAQVANESAFRITAYRYEPGYDWGTLQAPGWGRFPNRDPTWMSWALADSARDGSPSGIDRFGSSFAQGNRVEFDPDMPQSEQERLVDPYAIMEVYSLDIVGVPDAEVQDSNGDDRISFKELHALNPVRFSARNPVADPYEYTAQVNIAASFGMSQMIMSTTLSYLAEHLQTPPQQYFYADTSLRMQARYLRYIELNSHNTFDVTSPSGFANRWRYNLDAYNKGINSGVLNPNNDYPADIWTRIPLYVPQ